MASQLHQGSAPIYPASYFSTQYKADFLIIRAVLKQDGLPWEGVGPLS
jgi:hypothetical protein